MADESRKVEQEFASGEDETTPVIALSSVIIVIACLVAVASRWLRSRTHSPEVLAATACVRDCYRADADVTT
jgi:hypothetical protein